ncbi:hypothetical protein Mapa_006206 [Marchantia paleacea]|nr:hypothetical protein Mapa_006206 [Marchantia paleacea]
MGLLGATSSKSASAMLKVSNTQCLPRRRTRLDPFVVKIPDLSVLHILPTPKLGKSPLLHFFQPHFHLLRSKQMSARSEAIGHGPHPSLVVPASLETYRACRVHTSGVKSY